MNMLSTLLLSGDWISAAIRGIAIAIAAAFYFFGRKFPAAQVPANLTREELATPVPRKWSFLCLRLPFS
jgi:hypothetical protein